MECYNYLLLQNEECGCGGIEAPRKILIDRPKIILGKGSPKLPVDVVISALKNDKEIISRRHAEIITLDSGDCIINDLGALNGIFVNNVKVNSQKLCDGNIIQFGGVCNQAVGSLLDKSDVSLRYLFRSNILPSGVKKRTDSSVHNGGGKRAKVVDSLQNIVSPPLTNHKLTNTSGTGNESTVLLEKAKKEMEMEQANFVGQIERLKHEHHISETELRREIATMKAQSGVQIEAIEARDRALKSKNVHNKQLEEQLRSVQRSVAEIEQKLADQVQQNQVLRTQLESAYAKEKKSTSAQCMVSNSTLESSISCPLCDELLVEAVVLQCSHGYCRACIEQHWHATAGAAVQSRTDSSAHLSASACRCPRCNVSSNIRPTKTKHSLKSGVIVCVYSCFSTVRTILSSIAIAKYENR